MYEQLKQLLGQTIVYGFGVLVSPLISFLLLPVYTRYLTTADYGLLSLTFIVSMLLANLVTLGIPSGLIRIYFEYETKEEKDEVITSAVYSSIISGILLCVFFLLLSDWLAPILFKVKESGLYYRIIVYTILFSNLSASLSNIFRAEERALMFSSLSVVTLIMTLFLNIFFVVTLKRGVRGILEAGLAASALNCALLFLTSMKGKALRAFSLKKSIAMISFGFPFVLAGFAEMILSSSDKYFLDYYGTRSEVGLYSLGYRIASVLFLLVTKPFTTAWSPYMFKVFYMPEAKSIYRNVLLYYVLIAFWAGLGLSVFAREFLCLAATPEYYGAYTVVPWISLSYIVSGMLAVLVAGIQLNKKTKITPIVTFIAAGANIWLNFMLIPRYGMLGAAIATLLSYLILNLSTFFYSQSIYPVHYDFRRMNSVMVLSVCLYLLSLLIPETYPLLVVIPIKITIVLSMPLLLHAFGFFRPEELAKFRQLSKKRRLNHKKTIRSEA